MSAALLLQAFPFPHPFIHLLCDSPSSSSVNPVRISSGMCSLQQGFSGPPRVPRMLWVLVTLMLRFRGVPCLSPWADFRLWEDSEWVHPLSLNLGSISWAGVRMHIGTPRPCPQGAPSPEGREQANTVTIQWVIAWQESLGHKRYTEDILSFLGCTTWLAES